MDNYFSQIIYLTKKDKYKVPLLILVILIISLLDILGLGLIVPYIAILTDQNNTYLEVINNILSNFDIYLNSFQTILLISTVLILVFFFKAIGNILLNFILLNFVHTKEVKLRFELIKSYYNSKYELMISNRSSDSIENIINLVPQFLFYTLYPLLKIISNIIIASLISVFLFLIVGNFVFILILFLCSIVFIYDRLFGVKIKSYGKKSSQSNRSIIKGIQETLGGLKEIKILNKEKFFTNQILAGAIEYAKNKIKLNIISTSFAYIFEFLVILLVALFIITYVTFVGNDFISILPILSVLALAILRLIPKAIMISENIGKIRAGRYATKQVYDVYKLANNDKKKSEIKNTINQSFKSLKLSDVSYKYPETEKYVIQQINLEIKKGDHIGIKGESGSGKTTFVDLIIGHLSPSLGKIYFNNIVLDMHNYHNLVSLISYIPQKIFLIDDTLKRNITLCEDSQIDQKRLSNAISKSKIYDLVNNLDLGIETKVGEDGIALSGGQRQRVAIARSFYHDKEFIIFDEVTSALDPKTTNEIIKEISLLKENTVIIISHNHETIKDCDKIFEIRNNNLKVIK